MNSLTFGTISYADHKADSPLVWMLPWPLTRYNAVMVELIEGTGVGCYALAGARVTLTLTLARGKRKKVDGCP